MAPDPLLFAGCLPSAQASRQSARRSCCQPPGPALHPKSPMSGPHAILLQTPTSGLCPLFSSQVIGDLVLPIPGEIGAAESQLHSRLAEQQCRGLADGRAGR